MLISILVWSILFCKSQKLEAFSRVCTLRRSSPRNTMRFVLREIILANYHRNSAYSTQISHIFLHSWIFWALLFALSTFIQAEKQSWISFAQFFGVAGAAHFAGCKNPRNFMSRDSTCAIRWPACAESQSNDLKQHQTSRVEVSGGVERCLGPAPAGGTAAIKSGNVPAPSVTR